MKVKIYREPENESLILNEEELADYYNLIESLGLKSPVAIEDRKVPNVYQNLNDPTKKQLQAVCPRSLKIEDYTRSTIPLEVLRVYEFAKKNEMFDEYFIWYNDKAPDPMLVGMKYPNEEDRQKQRTWAATYSLLARWGDEALEIEELVKLGYDKIKQAIVDKVEESIFTCKHIQENPDMYVRKYLNSSLPYVSVSPDF